ncbi:MAG: DUF4317 domain-containing protein [Ruminococcaceae bacterium]|nr:DUF4317 domain-containing protein [Oscillospiraceae bacterium]
MIEKEIGEIRRTLIFDKTAITTIHGCYVNGNREIISTFEQAVGMMPEEEVEKYLALFKKVLSGTAEKNLIDVAFTSEQVQDSEEHRLLMALKNSELKDKEAVDKFFKLVTESLAMDENYVILLTYNVYDVPFRASDGRRVDAESNGVYSYILCSVCPVKMTKSALTYDATDKSFHPSTVASAIAAPAMGFLFPAFDGRQANIYDALFYTGSAEEAHEDFISAVFRAKAPMTAAEQNVIFRTVLAESLEESCSFNVAKKLHKQICERVVEHKESKSDEPLSVSKYQVREILEDCGVKEEKLESFVESFDEGFGKGTDLAPKNIVDVKRFEVRTPDVVIKVAPDQTHLIETRVIDGTKYILIRADSGVELNGLNVSIEG